MNRSGVSVWSFRRYLFRRIHVSWQVAVLGAGILGGVGLSLVPTMAIFAHWSWMVLAGLLIVAVFVKPKTWTVVVVLIAGLLIGMWRGTIDRVNLNEYSNYLEKSVTLVAKVSEDPSVGFNGELKLNLVNVVIDNVELPGQIWVSTSPKGKEVRRSDFVMVEGKLRSGFGNFPASMTYAKLLAVMSGDGNDPARDVRDAFGDRLADAIDNPAKDLGMGILAGQKTALPIDVSEAFRVAGLTHIVVASGYNLTILIRFARRLFAKISRLAALIGGAVSAFGFALVTGFSPSMTRAAMVAGLSLLAWYFGRKFHPIVLLLVVAAATVLINPSYVWGDAGWYMSFLAFAGVIVLAPLVKNYFWKQDSNDNTYKEKQNNMTGLLRRFTPRNDKIKLAFMSVRDIFVETMSAQLMVAPVIALMLGSFAPYGLLANLLVLPLLPLTMLLTFIAGIAGWLLTPLAGIIGVPAQIMLDYIIEVARVVGELPGAIHEVDFGIVPFLVAMAVLIAAMFYMRWRTGYRLRDSNVVG